MRDDRVASCARDFDPRAQALQIRGPCQGLAENKMRHASAAPRAAAATTDDIEAAPTLDSLPPEVLGVAFCFSQPLDMMPLTECSRQWRDMDLDTTYWKPVFLKDFSSPPRHWSEDDSLRARTDRLLHEADRRDLAIFSDFSYSVERTGTLNGDVRALAAAVRAVDLNFTSLLSTLAALEVKVFGAPATGVSGVDLDIPHTTWRGRYHFLWQDLRARVRAALEARRRVGVQRASLQDARFPRRCTSVPRE